MQWFQWRGFAYELATWLEALRIPVGEGKDADYYRIGRNMTVFQTGLDTESYDGLVKNRTLLTLFDEGGSMILSRGRRIQQTRIVRLTRRGGTTETAVLECGRVFEEIVGRGRFSTSKFVGSLRNVVQTPSFLIRNVDQTVHAQCILEFLAYSKP
jgi:hypothetical protein